MKTVTYCNVRYTTRAPLILLTVEKSEHKNFDFILPFFFLLMHNSKTIWCIYKRSAHQTSALLVRFSFSFRHFVCSYTHNLKTKGRIMMFYLSNNCIISEISILWIRALYEVRSTSYGSKHMHIATTFWYYISCILTLITSKLYII